MVDAERAGARLRRLEKLIEHLEAIEEKRSEAYPADPGLRAMTERWLELAIQVGIDSAPRCWRNDRGHPLEIFEVFEIFGA